MTARRITLRSLALLGLAAGLTACSPVPEVKSTPIMTATPVDAAVPATLNIVANRVIVPRSLKVSEENKYYPRSDIVWRGDAHGDRYAQVEAIFGEAMKRATQGMNDGTPAVLDIQVERFHSLTEKARYSLGGVHSIRFIMTLRHPVTGLPLTAPRRVQADLRGFGGRDAIAADQRGHTPKARITAHLAKVIRAELIAPGGVRVETPTAMADADQD